eukprot:SAG11_NODE_136_length_15118_cov_14.188495_17_plen_59_part_00
MKRLRAAQNVSVNMPLGRIFPSKYPLVLGQQGGFLQVSSPAAHTLAPHTRTPIPFLEH